MYPLGVIPRTSLKVFVSPEAWEYPTFLAAVPTFSPRSSSFRAAFTRRLARHRGK